MTSPSRTFVSDSEELFVTDAVAAILELEDGRCVLQHRDDRAGIWYPDHWGLFGGGVEARETAEAAMARELKEELCWSPSLMSALTDLTFDLKPNGLRRFSRRYFIVPGPFSALSRLEVREGQGLIAVEILQALAELRVSPYDAFVLFLYANRSRVRGF